MTTIKARYTEINWYFVRHKLTSYVSLHFSCIKLERVYIKLMNEERKLASFRNGYFRQVHHFETNSTAKILFDRGYHVTND